MQQRALIIDDSQEVCALVRACLSDEAIEVLCVSDGVKGIATARTLQPDVILIEADMPDLDGYAVCRILKDESVTAAIPIIFLSGETSTARKVEGFDLGAVDYIIKPFDPAELRARVRATLRTKFLMDLLSRRAQIDGLTGMWNRDYFEQRLKSEVARSRRTKCPLGCIMLDVDLFKSINDRHGHPFGDEVLCRIAQALVRESRQRDVVCRYGGEEFSILAPDTAADGVIDIAERMRQAIEGLGLKNGQEPVQVTCSFGVCSRVGDITVVDAADCALYQSKQAGRNRVTCVEHGCGAREVA